MLDKILLKTLVFLISFYRYVISPLLPARCRFYPTCSTYALEALKLHGGMRGGRLIFRRVCQCHPFGGSGVDFVPLPLYRFQYVLLDKRPCHFSVLPYRLR